MHKRQRRITCVLEVRKRLTRPIWMRFINHKGVVWPQDLCLEWASCLGDSLCEMSFTPSRDDPGLRVRPSLHNGSYNCIVTFVDDLTVVAKNPLHHLCALASKSHLRNVVGATNFLLSPIGHEIMINTVLQIKLLSKSMLTTLKLNMAHSEKIMC